MPRLDEVGERALVRRIASHLRPSARNVAGLADDAAVLPLAGTNLVVTTDALFGPTHFPAAASYEDVGWMVGAASLSDVAAMGAEPLGVLAALGLPRATETEALDGIVAGLDAVAASVGCEVLGGDTKESDVLALTGVGLGLTPRPLLRSGAHPGDRLVVTGPLGGASAALARLRAGGPRADALALLRPAPRVAFGVALREAGATAAMDLSDGLGVSLAAIAEASRVGVVLEAVPASEPGAEGRARALGGGGDYELLAAVPERALDAVRDAVPTLAVVGRVVPGSGVRTADGQPVPPAGYEHFRGAAP